MAYFLLYDSLCNRLKFDDHIPELSDEQKQWLVNTVNEEVNEKGKNVLIAICLLFNQQTNSKYFPTDQQFSIHQLEPYLQWLWFEFVKLHKKAQIEDVEARRNIQ
jgi:hypothetical protein